MKSQLPGESGFTRNPDGTLKTRSRDFYPDFIRAMHDIDYSCYFGYELCHALPVVNGKTVRIEFTDMNAQLAAEYMRQTIKENTK